MKFLKAKKIISIVLAALIFGVALFGTYTDAEAAGKKVTTSIARFKGNWKKAPAVKTGKTTVTMKVGDGMVKFVAPKTKTYKITVSNYVDLKDKKGRLNGHFNICEVKGNPKSQYLSSMQFKTQGGKADTLKAANKIWIGDRKEKKVTSYSYLPSRTATVKLKKGQPIYIYGWFVQSEKVRYTLTIK